MLDILNSEGMQVFSHTCINIRLYRFYSVNTSIVFSLYWNVKIESNTLAYCSMKQCPSNIIYLACALQSQEIMIYQLNVDTS